MKNLWDIMEINRFAIALLEKLVPQYEEPNLLLTQDGEFIFKANTIFGLFEIRAKAHGQRNLTTGNMVKCEIALNERSFIFFDTTGDMDWKFDFETDGFRLEFQKAVKAEFEELMREENN